MTKTSADVVPRKPANCAFVIATTKVDHPYQEIAILDTVFQGSENAGAFKTAVAPQVCELGGDAVIANISNAGYYVRGTVVRWTDSEPAGAKKTAP